MQSTPRANCEHKYWNTRIKAFVKPVFFNIHTPQFTKFYSKSQNFGNAHFHDFNLEKKECERLLVDRNNYPGNRKHEKEELYTIEKMI